MGGWKGQVHCTLCSLLDKYISQGDAPLLLLCCQMLLCWSFNCPLSHCCCHDVVSSLCHVICGGHVREVGWDRGAHQWVIRWMTTMMLVMWHLDSMSKEGVG